MKYKLNKEVNIFSFIIFLLVLFLNTNVVYAGCWECNSPSGIFTCSDSTPSSTDKCQSGWHTSNSPSCPSNCRPKIARVDITFDANGGTPSDSKYCNYTIGIGLQSCNLIGGMPERPTKSGYDFRGWSSTSCCSSDGVFDLGRVSKDAKYYACWATKLWMCKVDGTTVCSASKPTTSCGNGNNGWSFTGNYCYNSCGNSPGTPNVSDPEKDPEPGDPDDDRIIENYCEVDKPDNSKLSCNNSKVLESTCDKRTIIIDDVGYADVKIEQKGYISSVLTPDRTYAGAGFSFGVTYTNTIKWSYVGNAATGSLHKAITSKMNNKLKSYDEFVAGLKISELKFAGKIRDNFLVKTCYTSNTNIDYYNKELSVTCTFYLPDSVINNNGNVSYTDGSGSSITNKYYTPVNYEGNYSIKAKIVGMSRIKDATKDGVDGKSWTGTWSDTFEDCNISLYPLLYKSNDNINNGSKKYNFIYRPIDLFKPFPNRNAGINWFDWYSLSSNRERLESTYDSDNLQYTTILNNETISDIKYYNNDETHNYFAWNGSYVNGEWRSSFIDDYNYIERNGG